MTTQKICEKTVSYSALVLVVAALLFFAISKLEEFGIETPRYALSIIFLIGTIALVVGAVATCVHDNLSSTHQKINT